MPLSPYSTIMRSVAHTMLNTTPLPPQLWWPPDFRWRVVRRCGWLRFGCVFGFGFCSFGRGGGEGKRAYALAPNNRKKSSTPATTSTMMTTTTTKSHWTWTRRRFGCVCIRSKEKETERKRNTVTTLLCYATVWASSVRMPVRSFIPCSNNVLHYAAH